ncbi:MAG: hypothetical protein QNK23_16355 [Crocinitomicaceae bacterium]|nr:hypothetical protein [Crocinitomicaceae bacterium]
MKLKKSEKLKKSLSIVLVYALLFQEVVPFSMAMASPSVSEFIHSSGTASLPESIEGRSHDIVGNEAMECSTDALEEVYTDPVNSEMDGVMSVTSSGTGQVDNSGFSLGSTDGMVDKFTGDFSYSIPLMDVEGYPIVLTYNSNVAMNSEASWVGLGWNLNVGSVTREMRGIPDEFNGEQEITREFNQLDADNDGYKAGFYTSIGYGMFPSVQLTFLWGSYNSSYLGFGKTFDFGLQSQWSMSNDNESFSIGASFGLGYTTDTKNGIGNSSQFGLSLGGGLTEAVAANGSVTYGTSQNSRIGLTSRSISTNLESSLTGNLSYSSSTQLKYGTATQVPRIPFSSNTGGTQVNADISVRFGTNGLSMAVGGIFQDFNSSNQITLDANNEIQQPAIGYFHSGKRGNYIQVDNSYPIMDFNRAGGFEYSEEMSMLDFSAQTYDIFRANAMGFSSTFRGRRGDFGTYYDPTTASETQIDSHNPSASVTFGTSIQIAVGYAYANNEGIVESGDFTKILDFVAEANGDDFDDEVYFKSLGEPTPEDMDAYEYMGGAWPSAFAMGSASDDIVSLTSALQSTNGVSSNITSPTLNNEIDELIQSNHLEPKIVSDLLDDYYSYNDNYEMYDLNLFGDSTDYSNISVEGSSHREHNHLSAIEATSNNGMRYIFGIPAYNLNHSTVSFSIDGGSTSPTSGLVQYTAGTDNSVSNARGRSHYYDRTTVPAYAHTFLLTEMLSSDYIDRSADGPSLDDMGSYYKFNYTQLYGNDYTNDPYQWRFPVTEDQAFKNKGLLGSTLDDMANYTYGEKEIWYVHSVESKNFIAEIYLEDRLDAYGVTDENGGVDDEMPLKRIQKIVLYNRSERINNVNAEPIQTIEFEYDYSLCKNSPSNKHTYVPNVDYNNSGKLTLKAIRIKKGSSEEMALAAYEFDYSSENPDFNYAAVDAWGSYKANDTNKPNDLFPYVEQDETTANENAQAWKLTSIKTPLGGDMAITYEADRYGYVQNKRAMRHFEVHGMTNIFDFLKIMDDDIYNGTTNTGYEYNSSMNLSAYGQSFHDAVSNDTEAKTLYTRTYGKIDMSYVPNNVIIFELDEEYDDTLSQAEAAQKVRDEYFDDILNAGDRTIYFKTYSEVSLDGTVKDYVPLPCLITPDVTGAFDNLSSYDDDFEAVGVMPPSSGGANYQYGYVVLAPSFAPEKMKKKNPGVDDGFEMHPIQKAVLEFARTNLPDKIYGACATCVGNTVIDKAVQGNKNVNIIMRGMGYAHKMVTGLSTLRLYEPDGVKFGGTARVSQITYSDNWDDISGEYESTYSWTYSYKNSTVESGVASYEPSTARDENPLYRWNTYVNVRERFPNESKFTPAPSGDMLFPNPVVGYETVEVYFNDEDAYGHSESIFHTSKTFPTLEYNTAINKTDRVEKSNFLTGSSDDRYGFTQGYSLVTNDYHGKPLSHTVYSNQGNIQAQTVYEYYGLDDEIKMIDREGVITEERVGLEYDMHADSRYVKDHSSTWMFGLSAVWTIPSPIPLIIPIIFNTDRKREFYSHTFIKHINKSAIVKSIQTTNMQSVNTAENLVYDRETGVPLITSLKDEFNDELYSFSYPSHWYYDQFRSRSDVEGLSTAGIVTGQDLTTTISMTDNFVEGDHLQLVDGATVKEAWILRIDGSTATLIDSIGSVFDDLSGSITVHLLNSGRENRLTESMQNIVTKKAPDLSNGIFEFPQEEILSSGVLTYRNRNNIKCRITIGHKVSNELVIGSQANPYLYGIRGKLVPEAQYAWQTERVNATHTHGIRFDGEYLSFVPFYDVDTLTGEWYTIDETGHPLNDVGDDFQEWRMLGGTTLFDEYGKPLESADQIDVHSALLYSYSNELAIVPVAQAVNARKQDIAFDGFEDYDYYEDIDLDIYETHFDFADELGLGVAITTVQRHSGLSSLRISASTTATVNKVVGEVCPNPGDGMTDSVFVADSCLCIPPFEPIAGEYIVGAWIKVGLNNATMTTYDDGEIEVVVGSASGPTTYTFTPSGPIIDGWQRLEGQFTIPSNGTTIAVSLKNDSAEDVYYDDLRIHPFLAGMTTTVYDPKTLLPLATHDGYNFTTFYNYDENLNQVRVRVETVDGIQTVSETEFGGKKTFN